jgi:hypothetical protein
VLGKKFLEILVENANLKEELRLLKAHNNREFDL